MEHIKEILGKITQEIEQTTHTLDGLTHEERMKAKDRLLLLEYQRETLLDRTQKMVEKSNLGRRFKERTFDNFDRYRQPEAYDICLKYAREFMQNGKGDGLMLLGNPGTGKTHLAAAVTNYVIAEHGVAAKFGNFIDLLDDIKKSFHSDEDVVREMKRMPLMVVDDLGKERKSEWSEMILYSVINGRYEDYMPTIITTNLTPKQVENRFGEATFSRIFEMCRPVIMEGDDVRKEKANWYGK